MEDGNVMINVIYEDNHLIVCEKPINVLSQSDITCDDDFLSMVKRYIKDKYNKPGNVYLGLVHRLDRPTSGIMVFAKTSKAASRLSSQISKHEFCKTYMAVVSGKMPLKGDYFDKLFKDKKSNKSVVSPLGKDAFLSFERVSYKDGFSLVKINLKTGRSHQIRVQFSSRGFPLYGDLKYGGVKGQLALFASSVEFFHPITRERLKFSLDLPDRYPFNIF